MATIVIKRPGDAVEHVDPTRLLWMRIAFAHEVPGTVRLFIGAGTVYSIESISELKAKFAGAEQTLVSFDPPAGTEEMVVNKGTVVRVEKAVPERDHPDTRSVLVFGATTRLAVRQTEAESKQKLGIT